MKKINSKKYFKLLEEAEAKFYADLSAIELIMAKETGIDDIEFYWCDNSIVGIGSVDRKMKLIHRR